MAKAKVKEVEVKDKETKPTNDGLVPLLTIAKVIGRTDNRYRQLAREGIVPPIVKGKVPFVLAVQKFIAYQDTLIQGHGSTSLTDERRRLVKAQADIKEQDYLHAKGELIKVDTAMTLWGKVVQSGKSRLLSIPKKLAPIIITAKTIPEAEKRIEEALYEVANEFANPDLAKVARVEGHRSDLEDLDTPAKTKRKRVGGQGKKAKPRK